MSVEILTQPPASFFAGDTVKLRVDNPATPAPAWVAKLTLNGPDFFEKNAAADGTGHLITLLPADTGTLPGGVYSWAITATDGTDRVTLQTANTWIKPNPEVETMTWAKETLLLVQAHIKGRFPAGLTGHTINGNQISKLSLKEAMEIEKSLRAQVQAEDLAKLSATGEFDSAIQISFSRP